MCGQGAEQTACGKYRMMAVTLPGHGRKWESRPAIVTHGSSKGTVNVSTVSRRDNLTDMPFDKDAWLVFNEALSQMAQQFKLEHPGGVLTIVGHSIGGLMSLDAAIMRPHVFDRVLIMNPELGPPSVLLYPLEAVLKHLRLSNDMLGESCEDHRSNPHYTGGYCQFKFGNIGSVWSLGKHLYCRKWEIARCTLAGWHFDQKQRDQARRNMTALKSIQMVATHHDVAVESKRIFRFMDQMDLLRPLGHPHSGMCLWPAEMKHCYLTPGGVDGKWWEEYALEALLKYLTHGTKIDVVERTRSPTKRFSVRGDFCMPTTSSGLVGRSLAILPATQSDNYTLTELSGQTHLATVLFRGMVQMESAHVHAMHARDLEFIGVSDRFLLSSRFEPHARLRDVFVVAGEAQRIAGCVEIPLVKLDHTANLLDQLPDAVHLKARTLRFCSVPFSDIFCSAVTCGL